MEIGIFGPGGLGKEIAHHAKFIRGIDPVRIYCRSEESLRAVKRSLKEREGGEGGKGHHHAEIIPTMQIEDFKNVVGIVNCAGVNMTKYRIANPSAKEDAMRKGIGERDALLPGNWEIAKSLLSSLLGINPPNFKWWFQLSSPIEAITRLVCKRFGVKLAVANGTLPEHERILEDMREDAVLSDLNLTDATGLVLGIHARTVPITASFSVGGMSLHKIIHNAKGQAGVAAFLKIVTGVDTEAEGLIEEAGEAPYHVAAKTAERIIEALVDPKRKTPLCLTTYIGGNELLGIRDMALALPAFVSQHGVEVIRNGLPMAEAEHELFWKKVIVHSQKMNEWADSLP